MDRRKFIKHSVTAAATALLTKVAAAGELIPEAVRPSSETLEPKKMNIVVLTGSPRRNGNTNFLADRFIAEHKKTDILYSASTVPRIKWQAVWPATVAGWMEIAC